MLNTVLFQTYILIHSIRNWHHYYFDISCVPTRVEYDARKLTAPKRVYSLESVWLSVVVRQGVGTRRLFKRTKPHSIVGYCECIYDDGVSSELDGLYIWIVKRTALNLTLYLFEFISNSPSICCMQIIHTTTHKIRRLCVLSFACSWRLRTHTSSYSKYVYNPKTVVRRRHTHILLARKLFKISMYNIFNRLIYIFLYA